MVISAAIGSLILVSAYLCLRAGLAGQSMIDARSDAAQNARVVMNLIMADIRSATPLFTDLEFLGRKRDLNGRTISNLDFATHNYTPRALREGNFCEISYFIDENPETGTLSLWRRRDPSPDPDPLTGGLHEEIAQNVKSFYLEYYDGFEWFDTWGDLEDEYSDTETAYLASNLYGMPEAVFISIEFPEDEAGPDENEDGENPVPGLAFSTIVRLDLAATSYDSNSSASGETEETPAP